MAQTGSELVWRVCLLHGNLPMKYAGVWAGALNEEEGISVINTQKYGHGSKWNNMRRSQISAILN